MTAGDAFHKDLHHVLLMENVISPDQLNEAIREHERSKEPFINVLLGQGKCDEKKLVHVLSQEYGYTSVNPAVFVIDAELLKLIPKEVAEKYLALPITIYEQTLTVALANPTNLKAVDELRAITGMRVKPAVAQFSVLKKYIAKYYGKETEETEESQETAPQNEAAKEGLDDLVKMIEVESQDEEVEGVSEILKVAYETPVIKLVNMLLIEGIRRGASDIFIEPWENFVRVRARIDGLLEEVVRPQKSLSSAIVSRIKVMSELDIAERRIPQDGRFKVKLDGREVDMRVSILPTSFGEKVCMRILDTQAQTHDIAKLGFTEREQTVIRDCARKPHGMILVTGPTGSGKTTTLYSVLKYLDSPEVNLTTVEDPVEYQMPGINQVNVREQIGLTFPAALRSILRQDPDIILIGEIRDHTTLDIAVKAALTGHLVLSTLHTNDAASSIIRMVNMGLEPFLIASTVLMVSGQRLVRRLCQRCRYTYELEKDVLVQLGLDPDKEHTFYKSKGCLQCRHSGYKGRTVITEILEMHPEILKMIMKGCNSEAIKNAAQKHGMTTLRESAVQKALEGETSLEEVFRVTSEDQGSQEDSPVEEGEAKKAA